jgi:hypothetical protein
MVEVPTPSTGRGEATEARSNGRYITEAPHLLWLATAVIEVVGVIASQNDREVALFMDRCHRLAHVAVKDLQLGPIEARSDERRARERPLPLAR